MLPFLDMMYYSMPYSRSSLLALALAYLGLKRLSIELEAVNLIEANDSLNGSAIFLLQASGDIMARLHLDPPFLLGALWRLTICTVGPDYVISTYSRSAKFW
jgi:hypothetical protein